MQSNFASSLALLGPNANSTVEKVKKLSGGSIDIGSSSPARWCRRASISMPSPTARSTPPGRPGFFTGKDIAFALYSSVPFGPGMGEYLAWMRYGGGEQLMQEISRKYKVEPSSAH